MNDDLDLVLFHGSIYVAESIVIRFFFLSLPFIFVYLEFVSVTV